MKAVKQRPVGRALERGNSRDGSELGVLEGPRRERAVGRSRASKKGREEVRSVKVSTGHKAPVTECSKYNSKAFLTILDKFG